MVVNIQECNKIIKEYIPMIKLCGYYVDIDEKQNMSLVSQILERHYVDQGLIFQKKYSILMCYKNSMNLMLCTITIYFDTSANEHKVNFKFYNDLLKNFSERYPVSSENEILTGDINEIKEILDKIFICL